MATGLEGRVALVTGGGRGIGRAICLALAEDGAAVAVNFRRNREAADEVVGTIESGGRQARAYQASIDSWDEDQSLVEAVVADFGPVDILVNNAGIASRGNTVADTDPAELERVIRAHAFGPHHLCKLVLPGMRTRPRGDIVMISSTATVFMAANGAPYNMGKAALEALALTLAKEERAKGVRVNVVSPGLVETEMGRRLVQAMGVDDIATMHSTSPFGRVCQPSDVAAVVRFLVSEQAGYVSGQRIRVDAGAS